MPSPALTIIIPTHNRPKMLRRAVRSALAQTLPDLGPNLEIIVVDDGSEPPVALPEYPQVKVIRISPNRGGAAARNIGAKAAIAPLITYLDDDDELLPQMAQVSLEALSQATLPKPVGVLSALVEVDKKQQIAKTHSPPTLAKGCHFCLEDIDLQHSFASKQTLVVPRQVLLDIGGFDESFTSRVHTELFLRLNPVCSLLGVPTVTYRLTAHDGPRVSSGLEKREQNFRRLLEKHQTVFLSYPRRRYADFIFNHAYMLRRRGYPIAAAKAFLRALRVQPIQAIARLGSPYKTKLLKALRPRNLPT